MTHFIVIAGLDPAISFQRQMRGSSPRMTVLRLSSFRRKPESSFTLEHPKLDPDFRRGDDEVQPGAMTLLALHDAR
jgi:hypothetical protein